MANSVARLAILTLMMLIMIINATPISDPTLETDKHKANHRSKWHSGVPHRPQYIFNSFGGTLADIGCIKGSYQSTVIANTWGCFVWNQAHQNSAHEARCSYRRSGYPRKDKHGHMIEYDSERKTKGACMAWKKQLAYGF